MSPLRPLLEQKFEMRPRWGAKRLKHLHVSLPSKTPSTVATVGTFVGMLFYNGA